MPNPVQFGPARSVGETCLERVGIGGGAEQIVHARKSLKLDLVGLVQRQHGEVRDGRHFQPYQSQSGQTLSMARMMLRVLTVVELTQHLQSWQCARGM